MGPGKTTLLKILTGITPPTTGSTLLRGRVGSLLEVGTGFHQELTGRENIYLNGAILGMTRREISHAFDSIVEFAGVSRFLDTPVKRYSTGMYVRLAFAVAAHLSSEILLVDEVLAVGDAAFNKRALGMMHDAADTGRTVVFVSHQMSAIAALCDRAFVLDRGKLQFMGDTEERSTCTWLLSRRRSEMVPRSRQLHGAQEVANGESRPRSLPRLRSGLMNPRESSLRHAE